jgi:hypothetical protein
VTGRGKLIAAATVAAVFGLVLPAAAGADDRFAEPGGDGAEPCLQSDPCSIETAINSAPSGSGVLLAGGTYNTSTELIIAGDTSVTGDLDDPATIASTAPTAVHIAFSSPGSIVKDFAIDHDPASGSSRFGLQIENGIVDRLTVDSTGDYACFVQGLLYDSFCHMTAVSNGVAAGLFSPSPASGSMTNVTAIGDGPGSYGLAVSSTSGLGNVQLEGTNVIAQAAGTDTGGFGGSGTSHLALTHSDFASLNFSGTATGTDVSANGNISDESTLAGDLLHETPSSPTIDAGIDNLTQPLDIDQDPRIQGNAVDIGADEADGVAPQTKITKKPARKTKSRTAKFVFTSTEPGSTFRCKLDKKPYASCSSGAKNYRKVPPGKHRFQVKATDPFGNEDATAASYSWKIKKPKKTHHH